MLNELSEDDFISLGKIIKYKEKSTIKAGEGKDEGLYPFFTSSNNLTKRIDSFIYDDECIILGTGGKASVNYYDGKFATSTDNFTFKAINDYLTNFVYRYLLVNIDILQKGFKGVGIQHISKDYVNEIKIPKISKEGQEEIIERIELLDKSKFLIQKIQKNIIFLINFLKSNKKYINYAIIKAIKLKGEHYV